MQRILIVEDEEVIRSALRKLLERRGFAVEVAGSVEEAEASFAREHFGLILADLKLPGAPGTQLIEFCDHTPVVIMTSYASVSTAVESMKMGAVDFITKPIDHDKLVITIGRILKQSQIERQNAALKGDIENAYPVGRMVGRCPAMRAVNELVTRVAPTDATVLIFGESGTGKELVARALHQQSACSDGPMVTVNCASIPNDLIESELFGHEKGAFTGAIETRVGMVESADGGTLFLDEVGELPLPVQARLLRVLQEGLIRRVGASRERKVDVRLVAATHRDLARDVRQGSFREDLFFRLRVMEIHLPPLRERGNDKLLLAEFLLGKACRKLNRHPLTLDDAARSAILVHHWPGNVREMENAIERAVILCDGPAIGSEHLALDHGLETAAENEALELSMEEYFRRFVIEHQDKLTEGEIAQRLGISRKSLWEKRRRFAIPRNPECH
ncbi:MAG TPA: sigma-54 dependent transcriptional regulator [Gammaproteobacteria bacterium]